MKHDVWAWTVFFERAIENERKRKGETMTIRKNNPDSPFWRAAAAATERVKKWPAWKRGEPENPLAEFSTEEQDTIHDGLYQLAERLGGYVVPFESDGYPDDGVFTIHLQNKFLGVTVRKPRKFIVRD
jgi:hypothetical protein